MGAQAFAGCGQWEEASALVEGLWQAGHKPSAAAIEAALVSCRDAKKFLPALSLLQKALDPPSLSPSNLTNSAPPTPSALPHHPNAGDRERDAVAAAVSAVARAEGHSSGWLGRCRVLAMEACLYAAAPAAALSLFTSVRAQGKLPAPAEWRAALHAMGKLGMWRRALAALPILHRSGVGVGQREVGCAAAACVVAAQWGPLRSLLSACAREELGDLGGGGGVGGDLAAVGTRAMSGAASSEAVDRVLSMLREVEGAEGVSDGFADASGWEVGSVKPSSSGAVLSAAIAAHGAHGAWGRVRALLAQSEECEVVLSGPRLNRIVAMAAKAGEWRVVLRLLASRCKGRESEVYEWSTFSYEAALKACRKLGEWREAVRLLRRLREPRRGVGGLQSRNYAVAIGACLVAREWRALEM